MIEKKLKPTIEQLKNNEVDQSLVEFETYIPYNDCVDIAKHIVSESLIVDGDVIYRSCHEKLHRLYWILTYCSTIDTSDLGTSEGRVALYDYIVPKEHLATQVNDLFMQVYPFKEDLYEAAEKKNEYKNSTAKRLLDILEKSVNANGEIDKFDDGVRELGEHILDTSKRLENLENKVNNNPNKVLKMPDGVNLSKKS